MPTERSHPLGSWPYKTDPETRELLDKATEQRLKATKELLRFTDRHLSGPNSVASKISDFMKAHPEQAELREFHLSVLRDIRSYRNELEVRLQDVLGLIYSDYAGFLGEIAQEAFDERRDLELRRKRKD